MSLLIVIANRFSKIIGNIFKALCYPYHFFFPNKRFTIPTYSAAFISSKKQTLIPKILWQTNYTNQVSLPVYLNYLYNRLMSLSYEYRYVSTEDRLAFFKEHASKDLLDAYMKLNDGAAQADLWRLFVLNKVGGIYMDIDAHLVWPISRQIKSEDRELILLNKQHFTNYFIASQKGNSAIEETIEIIVDNIANKRTQGGVYSLTGPTTFNMALEGKKVNYKFYRYVCVQGSFTNEYFQYIDKKQGKWTHANNDELLK